MKYFSIISYRHACFDFFGMNLFAIGIEGHSFVAVSVSFPLLSPSRTPSIHHRAHLRRHPDHNFGSSYGLYNRIRISYQAFSLEGLPFYRHPPLPYGLFVL